MNNQPDSAKDRLIRSLTRLVDRPLEEGLPGEAVTVAAEPTERYFGFTVGPWHLAASAGLFCELLADPDISPLPNAPPLLRGLCNVRGNLIPVFDLHQLRDARASGSRVLLLGRQQEAVGLLVDSLPVSLDLPVAGEVMPNVADDLALEPLLIDSCQHLNTLWHRLHPLRLGPELLALCQRWKQERPAAEGQPATVT